MKEKTLHRQIATYLKLQHKDIIFNSDASGVRLTIGSAKQLKYLRSSRAMPDMVIYQPNKFYKALFLEIKIESPFKKDGDLKKQMLTEKIKGITIKYDHLKEQKEMLDRLNLLGYRACFVWSLDQAKEVIYNYLNS